MAQGERRPQSCGNRRDRRRGWNTAKCSLRQPARGEPAFATILAHTFSNHLRNLCRDGRVVVTMVAAPNIAVSVRGRAQVVRERMRANENSGIVEIDIAEVKNDMVPTLVIENGTIVSAREEYRDRFQTLAAEVEGMA